MDSPVKPSLILGTYLAVSCGRLYASKNQEEGGSAAGSSFALAPVAELE